MQRWVTWTKLLSSHFNVNFIHFGTVPLGLEPGTLDLKSAIETPVLISNAGLLFVVFLQYLHFQ